MENRFIGWGIIYNLAIIVASFFYDSYVSPWLQEMLKRKDKTIVYIMIIAVILESFGVYKKAVENRHHRRTKIQQKALFYISALHLVAVPMGFVFILDIIGEDLFVFLMIAIMIKDVVLLALVMRDPLPPKKLINNRILDIFSEILIMIGIGILTNISWDFFALKAFDMEYVLNAPAREKFLLLVAFLTIATVIYLPLRLTYFIEEFSQRTNKLFVYGSIILAILSGMFFRDLW